MSLPVKDLDAVLDSTKDLWDELRGKTVFFTGAGGFIGSWLLESFLHANHAMHLGAHAVCLTRGPGKVSSSVVEWIVGDVRDFKFPQGRFSHVIHAAAQPDQADTMVEGTRQVLEFAALQENVRFLFLSSGAVYGPLSLYAEAKKEAEWMCQDASAKGVQAKIARCFSFVGPRLPLDAHYAIGNFIADALSGGPIRVKGDGTPVRSYLYASDMAAWLWTVLLKAKTGQAVDVGSAQPTTIFEAARAVAGAFNPRPKIEMENQNMTGMGGKRYLPDIGVAQNQFNLKQTVNLEEAVRKTVDWHRP
ncbi:MAG: NAD(P)-dependent oxidoreductase [Candidatus Omnitrophica bacterium]|nr:NAD(P)-dependent oxidoreductase [Candidatus Omnitrophota bacterium]